MSSAGTNRRRFLSFWTDALLALIGLMVAIPGVGYFLAPLIRKDKGQSSGFLDAGPLSDFPVGKCHLRVLDVLHEDGWKKTRSRHAIWVRRTEEGTGKIAVLSPICPHLGCPIAWHPDQGKFSCPCHGGVFDASGDHVAGPPPRPMDALQFEVRTDRLWVRWQDFKIGVAKQIPVNA